MTVSVDHSRCDGCNNAREPLCVKICPGDLFFKEADGRILLRRPEECWDCASCIKICPRQAVGLMLPVEAGGQGSRMFARKKGREIQWIIVDPKGNVKEIRS